MEAHNNTLWLCLRFTHLSLNSLDIDINAKQAYAVNAQHKIWQCNATAEKFGVRTNMSISHALMLHAELLLVERDLLTEQQRLQTLNDWAYHYSSIIVNYNDQSMLLEIGRSINLFNNLEQLINLIRHDLKKLGMNASLGLSHTPKSAYALSFSQNEQNIHSNSLLNTAAQQAKLAAIKISHLELDEKTKTKLHDCGFSNFADLQSIDTHELGQRFGKELLNYLEQLEGKKADPQTSIHPEESFEACLDFAEPISNLQWIEQQIERLLTDLHNFINAHQLFCRSFTWRFFHENKQLLGTLHIEMSGKHSSLATMLELSQLRLAQLDLKWVFSSIELSSHHLYLKKHFNDDLFDPKPNLEQFNQLIDKLSSRLGHSALFGLDSCLEQLPEMANKRQHINNASRSLNSNAKRSLKGTLREQRAHYSGRFLNKQGQNSEFQSPISKNQVLYKQPLWLLPKPQCLAKKNNKPIYNGPLNIINGPDRISSHWWLKHQSRDYYMARQKNGRLLWVYFDRSRRDWYLHGLFS